MPKIKQFDDAAFSAIRSRIEKNFATIEKRLGVKLQLGTFSYIEQTGTFSVKIEGALLDYNGEKRDIQSPDDVKFLHFYDTYKKELNLPDAGSKVIIKNYHYSIVGMKRPTRSQRINNKYKFILSGITKPGRFSIDYDYLKQLVKKGV